MATDFGSAVRTQAFLGSGDVLLELDGAELPVHSSFLVRRCPWFTGLFQGRSSGGWLAGRRDEAVQLGGRALHALAVQFCGDEAGDEAGEAGGVGQLSLEKMGGVGYVEGNSGARGTETYGSSS